MCAQASILFQLCSGHIGLNKHLYQIKSTISPTTSGTKCQKPFAISSSNAPTTKSATLSREVSSETLSTYLTYSPTQMQPSHSWNTCTLPNALNKHLETVTHKTKPLMLSSLSSKTPFSHLSTGIIQHQYIANTTYTLP